LSGLEVNEQLTSIADDLYIGAPLLSRIATYYPDRFENYVFLDIGYMAPGQLYTEAKVKADQKVLGYQIFFIRDNSGYVVDKHVSSPLTPALATEGY